MYPLLPFDYTCVAFVGVSALAVVATTLYDASLWRSPRYRSLAAVFVLPIALGLVFWRWGDVRVAAWGVDLAWFVLPLFSLGVVFMLLASPVNRVLGFVSRRRERHARSARAGARRQFLRQAAAVLPAGAVAVGTAAMAGNDTTRIVEVRFKFR